jgi:hypothetical protein
MIRTRNNKMLVCPCRLRATTVSLMETHGISLPYTAAAYIQRRCLTYAHDPSSHFVRTHAMAKPGLPLSIAADRSPATCWAAAARSIAGTARRERTRAYTARGRLISHHDHGLHGRFRQRATVGGRPLASALGRRVGPPLASGHGSHAGRCVLDDWLMPWFCPRNSGGVSLRPVLNLILF